jgi:hypothetical protein
MARRVAVAQLGGGDARALRRFRRLWKRADSGWAIARLATAARQAYQQAHWRGRVLQAADVGSPSAAALNVESSHIRGAVDRLRMLASNIRARLGGSGAVQIMRPKPASRLGSHGP